jgi:hypothetical protein
MLCSALVFLLLAHSSTGQKLDSGLWNFGRAFSVTTLNNDSVHLRSQLCVVKVYPGFAVVKSTYNIILDQGIPSSVEFLWRDTGITRQDPFRTLHNIPSASMKVLAENDTVPIQPGKDGFHFRVDMPVGKMVRLTTFQICPASQAQLSDGKTIKEENGLIISFEPWKRQGIRQVLVQLSGNLTLTNLIGVHPATVVGTMTQLQWQPQGTDTDLVVWYDGAAPDFKYEKKVLPMSSALYEDINEFDAALFGTPAFKPLNKDDFKSTTGSTGGSVLYFLLFSIPWIVLGGFIIFLLIKPKKKTTA